MNYMDKERKKKIKIRQIFWINW